MKEVLFYVLFFMALLFMPIVVIANEHFASKERLREEKNEALIPSWGDYKPDSTVTIRKTETGFDVIIHVEAVSYE